MGNMIRIGICGCGVFIQRAVLPMMARVGSIEVLAAFDSDQSLLSKVCHNFQIDHTCGSFEELLNIDGLDVIYIASPNKFHKSQTIAAANAGKHVFCQKPMGLNTAECREMLTICHDKNVKLGIGFCYRFQGAQQLAKELIAQGKIGEVSHINFSFNLGGFTRESVGWRCDRKMSGGGPLMDIAPHIIDLSSYLLDDEVESVMAYVRPGETEDDVETDAVVLMHFSKDIIVSFDTSFVRRNEHYYTITGTMGEIRSAGTMAWQTGGRMTLHRNREIEDLSFSNEEHIEKEMRLFCEALESNKKVPVPGEAGLHAQAVIDAIYQSGRTGKRCLV
jgi:predicted dehydrogenase